MDLLLPGGAVKMASKTVCTVVAVGDAKVGKTALIRSLTQKQFQEVKKTFLIKSRIVFPSSPFQVRSFSLNGRKKALN